MAILSFQKPDKVIMIESDDFQGVFEFRPLEKGFGLTIGNALRRILLSSLEGYAITAVRIEGVDHEFSSIKGVVEDVTDIILNLKKIRFRRQLEGDEKVNISVSGKETFTAADIASNTSNFQVLNPEVVICNMEKNVKLNVEITIEKGRGYVTAEDNKKEDAFVGTIFIDSIHTPIVNVKYTVDDNYRVEQKTDYEKLILDIKTDGSITPKDALTEAAKILIHHFMLFSDEKITIEEETKIVNDDLDETALHLRQLLKTKLTDLNLSVRSLNCLKAADVDTLGELVTYQKHDLLKIRNFGKKSLSELEELVKSKGLDFGMNVSKYKLDKE